VLPLRLPSLMERRRLWKAPSGADGEGPRSYQGIMDATLAPPPTVVGAPLQALLERICAQLHPVQVWLFGSRARGDERADSDWDLAVVLPDDADDSLFDPLTAWRLIRPGLIPVDLATFTASEFVEDRTTPNTIPFSVAQEGLLLYER
jgi:predicted nucleotidyltransferase